MTLHTYSNTERNTTNTQDGVSREGSVSPRGTCEAMHGADASCSPPMVVAERTLPTAGLSPSGWPSRESYRQTFPSGGPAGRTRSNGLSSTFGRVRTRCGAKSIRGPWTGSLMPHEWKQCECGGPLNRGINPNAHAAVTLNFPRALLAVTSQPHARYRHPHIPVRMRCRVNGLRPAPGGYSR